MRSGNGRHRRPRQAPAIFVTAGVTGAGLALPLLSAGGAHAADTATWDRVAQCESGGVWSAASGNGFYGGLQLTQQMWDHYGGSAYASRPDLASRAQQIAVAESILDDRGPDAWPSCAVNAGLTQDGRIPQVDPGSTSTPRPAPSDGDGSADSSDEPGAPDSGLSDSLPGPSDEPSQATPSPSAPTEDPSGSDGADHSGGKDREPSGPAAPGGDEDGGAGSGSADGATDPSAPADPSDGATDPSAPADPSDGGSRPDTTGTPHDEPTKGRHRGGADAHEGDGADRASGGRHASRGDDAHRSDPVGGGDYTVRPGDSLSAIARAHRLSGGWTALYERNEGVIGSDADLIQPGQRLDLGRDAG
ncbi:transglycosylase family protein [Streptomyces sp. NPDC056411]|uniref:transglycosylase family protein n=1 Tax=Streptomyces sp. NPDC056411 TaxID=3345813 RepID=UPI0035E31DF5